MLILTQQQNMFVNLDKMETIFVEKHGTYDKYCIFAQGTSGKSVALGQYEEEARAREVLLEIAREYIKASEAKESCRTMPSDAEEKCSTCFWNDGQNDACRRPDGYNCDRKANICWSWTAKKEAEKSTKEG